MRVTVFGLWHLGCVTAACLAEAGHHVVGLDGDENTIRDLQRGLAPLHQPGLDDLLQAGLRSGGLHFTTSPVEALTSPDVLWITFDTPVNDQDEADVEFVRRQLLGIAAHVQPGTLLLISSQVPVGFTRELEAVWPVPNCRFACSPENLRLGKTLDLFRKPDRVVLGTRDSADYERVAELLGPFTDCIEWMSVESAEMTKHAINAFLATSVTFINELARVCEAVGADAKEVERGLRSEARIGPRAYLSPGAAFAGGTLARDVRFLIEQGSLQQIGTLLLQGVWASNDLHKGWVKQQIQQLLGEEASPVVAVLGLTYKPGTSTLRRSSAVELCCWLREQGAHVRAHDPGLSELPEDLRPVIEWTNSPLDALRGADLAVVATEWPEYRDLSPADLHQRMRQARVLDPNHFLAKTLGQGRRILYVATGKAA